MILITGATGKSGSATANELFKLGASYRALIRNPEKENDLKEIGADVILGSVEDKDSLESAMTDIETVLIRWKRGLGSCSGAGYVNGKKVCSIDFNILMPHIFDEYKVKKK